MMTKTRKCKLCGDEIDDEFDAINRHKIEQHFWYLGELED